MNCDIEVMARPLRNSDPSFFRHIIMRTDEARLWMVPSREMEELLGGIVARYQEILGIEIFAYCFLTNHFHLLIRAPRSNTDEFMENVNREIARRVNWLNKRQGKFWGRPYEDKQVPREVDIVAVLLYITTNCVHHGLVHSSSKWPGLSSYEQCFSLEPRKFCFHHHSAGEGEEKETHHFLKLTSIPEFSFLNPLERAEKLKLLIEEKTTRIIIERKEKGSHGFFGVQAVKAQKPGEIPHDVAHSSRASGYSKCPETLREHRLQKRERTSQYRHASMRFRLGDMMVEFPPHSYKPPLHRKPRLFHFTPLTVAHLQFAS